MERRRALTTAAALLAGVAAAWPGPARAAYVVRPWPQAKPVPELALVDLDGRAWTLAALAGQVVVLNFWATWCDPCRREMPALEALAARHANDRLVVIAVNYREPAALIRSFLERMPFKPTILLDPDGEATSQWTPRVFPTTVLIGRDGRPVASVLGDLDWAGPVARDLLEPLLRASTPRDGGARVAPSTRGEPPIMVPP